MPESTDRRFQDDQRKDADQLRFIWKTVKRRRPMDHNEQEGWYRHSFTKVWQMARQQILISHRVNSEVNPSTLKQSLHVPLHAIRSGHGSYKVNFIYTQCNYWLPFTALSLLVRRQRKTGIGRVKITIVKDSSENNQLTQVSDCQNNCVPCHLGYDILLRPSHNISTENHRHANKSDSDNTQLTLLTRSPVGAAMKTTNGAYSAVRRTFNACSLHKYTIHIHLHTYTSTDAT